MSLRAIARQWKDGERMEKFTIISRVVLIGVALYGIFQICEHLKPQMETTTHYIITFIVLFVLSFWSIIDWNLKIAGKGK